jgi:hypothetical protein
MPEIAESERARVVPDVARRKIQIQKGREVLVLTEGAAATLMAELFDHFEKLVSKKRRKSSR